MSVGVAGRSVEAHRGFILALGAVLVALGFFASSPPALAAAIQSPHPSLPDLNQAGFARPCGAATDSHGDLYVADGNAGKVKIFSPAGAPITEFTPVNGEPCGIAVDSTGAVYVASFLSELVKYKPEGAFPPSASTTYAPDTSIGSGSGILVPGSAAVTAVAVNPANNHVFVGEGLEHISEYTASGTKVAGAIGEGLVAGALYCGIAVNAKTGNLYVSDLANSKVYVFNPAGTEVLAEFDGSESPDGPFEVSFSNLAVDESSGDVLVPDIIAHGVVDQFNEEGEYVTTIASSPAFTNAEPNGIAVDNGAQSPNKGNVYVGSGDGTVYAFGPLPSPNVPLAVKKEGAGTGTVTSSPAGIDCGATCEAEFEEGSEVTLSPSAGPGSRFKQWSGCTSVPKGQCKVVLGEGGAEVSATFVPAGPSITNVAAAQVTSSSAKLEGLVNPNGDATTYQFEYLTKAAYEANGNSFSGTEAAAKAPASPASIGSDFTDIAVGQVINGLSSSTEYIFRLIAASSSGTSESAAGSFTTQVSQASGLPDGRAYEQASPIDKHGGSLQAFPASTKASVNGDAVTFESAAGIPGGEGAQEFPTYLASRKFNPTTGRVEWTTQGLLPPASLAQGAAVLGWTPDFGEVFDTATKFGSGTDFLGRSSADASLGTVAHSDSNETNYSYAGSSGDKGTVLFSSTSPLPLPPGSPAPAAERFNLYAWSRDDGEVRLAGVLPDGSAPPDGAVAGLFGNSGYTQQQPGVMSDGSAYFTAGNQAYLRLDPTAPESPDQDSKGKCIPEEGFACTIQVSASEKTNGGGPGGSDAAGTQPAEFMAASTSTSKAFLTGSEKLTDDATTGPEPALAAIARAKLGGLGAEDIEEGFLPAHASGIVNDGSHIYWADPTTGNIGRAALNGEGAASAVEPEFLTVGGKPRWVAVDSTYAYWTDAGEEEANDEGTIGRAKLDGSEAPEAEFITGASQPEGIAVSGTNVYWANDGTAAIGRASIGGSAPEPSWHPLGGIEAPQGLALDSQHLYWTSNNAANSFVSLANLDGTEEKFAFLGSNTIALRGIAVDSSHVYWVSRGENKIGRANLGLSGVEQGFISGIQKPKGITADAAHLYWSANGETLPNPGKDLYRYDLGAPAGERLTDLTVDTSPADTCLGIPCGAQVQGVLGASADGSHVYYVANGVPDGPIANSPNVTGESAEPGDCQGPVAEMTGSCNLYLWSEEGGQAQTTFIARLDPSEGVLGDAMNWVQTLAGVGGDLLAQKTARVSADGKTLLFRSKRSLTAYDSEGQPELYRFDAIHLSTLCVSCSPTGVAPRGAATLQSIFPPAGGAGLPALTLSRSLSSDGKRVFFETLDKLVAGDTNGDLGCAPWGSGFQQGFIRTCQDVYEWEANETGSCHSEAQNGGCLYLISTGKGKEPAFFSDASESGDDVFIFTADQLAPQDKDELIDVYDAKVGGGLPYQSQTEAKPCEGEACKGQPAVPPAVQSPGSSNFSGPGNQKPARHHKKKHHKKKKQQKHKKHHKKSKRAAKTTGRASR